MAKGASKTRAARGAGQAKYDAQNTVLEKTYGARADLRRELADSQAAVTERAELLKSFADCADSQRSWLLLEDYFSKLLLARKDFTVQNWWPRLLASQGQHRLEELALLFLRSNRPLPTELIPCANLKRLAQIEQAEKEQQLLSDLEQWMFPANPHHLDAPRASLRVLCSILPPSHGSALRSLNVKLNLIRPRTGEKTKSLTEIIDLTLRAAHEQELFPPADWEFIQWLTELNDPRETPLNGLVLTGLDLLRWLARWSHRGRLEMESTRAPLLFQGQIAEFQPHLKSRADELLFTHRLVLPTGQTYDLDQVVFFAGHPTLALIDHSFFLIRNAPTPEVLDVWLQISAVPAYKLSHRFLAQLRKTGNYDGSDWEKICIAHRARPQFTFELDDDTVKLRLLAKSERDHSIWQWNGHDWQPSGEARPTSDKPEFLDDPRLEPATLWLRRLDWFTPEPGLWIGDAKEAFLAALAAAWPDRPAEAEYLGNPPFHRLFLTPHKLRPHLVVHGSGIDWFSVSAAWEIEGLKLSQADLERLASATTRFVKLPDSGWLELDTESVLTAQETLANLGLDGLTPVPQRISLLHAAQLDETTLQQFGEGPQARQLHQHIAEFKGVPPTPLPAGITADLRSYQKTGVDFLCHLSRLRLGGVLADDMGLGKTLQTLVWLVWLKEQSGDKAKPSLVICPASVLHNWQREANRFTPGLKVLILASGAARHNLRKQIPQHDLIVTNYALLRRDLAALQQFEFQAVILDEAQFIKNPDAQVTQSVKQLRSDLRLALTGTPLENRLLDLWSIIDFVQPGYLGARSRFEQIYDSREDNPAAQGIARKRLSAKLRPLLLRRLKRQVAKDLPDRVEERRDCELGEEQRKLYLAELRRSRELVMRTVADNGLAKSKLHVLAALTRLRQICCHPQLVGNDAESGKTDTLFELLEPLVAEGQKVLVFSQFVRMLRLLERECQHRQIPTHLLSGATKNRQDVVQAFQNDQNPAVFLLSLRAAGTGLNLTAASYVVLYDPWWNPAVEAQAIDRSHRIGQTRKVNAYRLIAPGTVEEKIWELQQRKAQTIVEVLGEAGFARNLTKMDLEYLFAEDGAPPLR